jgi:uncharacterized delta-60 repeat protein
MKKLILSASIVIMCLTHNAQVSEEWAYRYNGSGDFSDKYNAIAFDASGNILLCGYSYNPTDGRDILLVKLNTNGDTLWTATYNGPGVGDDEANAIYINATGDIFIAGYEKGNGTGDDAIVLKYSTFGNLLWKTGYNFTANEDDRFFSITSDNNGNIYAVGISDNDVSSVTNDDIITVKINSSTSAIDWAVRYNGTANGTDRAVNAVTDANGNIYVAGRTYNGFDDDYITLKYNTFGVVQWAKIVDGGSGDDRITAMVKDGGDNIIVTGRSDNGSNDDYYTIKYSSAGNILWQKFYDGSGTGHDRPTAITTDGSGNVYVTGQSDEDPSSVKNYNFTTIKYNSAGVQQWKKSHDGNGGGDDVPSSIAVDINGNVLVAGQANNGSVAFPNNDFVAIKYNSSGVQQWLKNVTGNTTGSDDAAAIMTDGSGNVYVAGHVFNNPSQKDAICVKYDNSGNETWKKIFTGKGDNYDNVNAMTIDNAGFVYLAGYTLANGKNRDFYTAKLTATGDTSWIKTYNGTSSGEDEATAITTDASGFVYVTGYSKNKGNSSDITTIKYKSNGDTVWVRNYNYSANKSDKGYAIDIDAAGNVYVAGKSDSDPGITSNDDFITIKYNSAGVQQWVKRYNGTGNSDDIAIALKVAASGNVYITGKSRGVADYDYVTVKYNSTGTEVWVKTYSSGNGNDAPVSLKIDNAENIIVTGKSVSNDKTNDDVVTVKYNASGVEQWVTRYNGTMNANDRANALAIDNAGNVYVAGESVIDTSSNLKNYDYLLIKYNSNGAEQWSKNYNGLADADDYAKAIAIDDSMDIYVTGQSDNGNKNYDISTVKYSSQGLFQWKISYDGSIGGEDNAAGISVNSNNIYVAGSSWGSNSQKDIVAIKYSQVLNTSNLFIINENTVQVIPNPFSNSANIILGNNIGENVSVSIYDINGKLIYTEQVYTRGNIFLDGGRFSKGVYLFTINSADGEINNGRFIVE